MESLDRLTGDLGEVASIFRSLEHYIGNVRIGGKDEASIEVAIQRVDEEIDKRTLPYQANDVVQQIAAQFKEKAADAIRQRAKELK